MTNHFTTTVSRVLGSVYGNLPHVGHDTRSDECYRMGGQRCGHHDGRCNQGVRYLYDDTWLREKKKLEAILQDE